MIDITQINMIDIYIYVRLSETHRHAFENLSQIQYSNVSRQYLMNEH